MAPPPRVASHDSRNPFASANKHSAVLSAANEKARLSHSAGPGMVTPTGFEPMFEA